MNEHELEAIGEELICFAEKKLRLLSREDYVHVMSILGDWTTTARLAIAEDEEANLIKIKLTPDDMP